jgi:hypothetical protein
MRKKNNKGALSDLFLFMALAFIIVMFSVTMYFIGNKTYDALITKSPALQQALGNDGNATDIINSSFGKVPTAYNSLKWITVMLIFGFALSILITSFLVKTNPIFFVPYTIILIIAIIVAVPISNSYDTIYKTPLLAESFQGFFGANWIMLNLPIWITVIGLFAGILMFINVVRNY